MEEKNRIVTLYIENKVKELEDMSMFVSKDNVQKVINSFLNRSEDIEIIKTTSGLTIDEINETIAPSIRVLNNIFFIIINPLTYRMLQYKQKMLMVGILLL